MMPQGVCDVDLRLKPALRRQAVRVLVAGEMLTCTFPRTLHPAFDAAAAGLMSEN